MSKKQFMERSAKAITKEAEKSAKLKRQLEKRETWVQCQCPHSMDMLRPIAGNGGDRTERKYQCRCGKIVRLNRMDSTEVEKAFQVVDQVCDCLKIAAKPRIDDEILNQISSMQYNLIGLQKTYMDYTAKIGKRQKDRNQGQEQYSGSFNSDPKKSLW